MNPKIKNILIFGGIFVLLIGAYLLFFRQKEVAPLATTAGTPLPAATAVSESSVGQEFLALLLNLRTIKLDDSTFSNPAFNSLQDYTITLVPEGNEGRPNPFDAIGVDVFSGESEGSAISSASSNSSEVAPSL